MTEAAIAIPNLLYTYAMRFDDGDFAGAGSGRPASRDDHTAPAIGQHLVDIDRACPSEKLAAWPQTIEQEHDVVRGHRFLDQVGEPERSQPIPSSASVCFVVHADKPDAGPLCIFDKPRVQPRSRIID